jgi:hypothetical protein
MKLTARLARLESLVIPPQENRYIFMTVSGHDHTEIIAFKYRDLTVVRVPGEDIDIFKDRAAAFFAGKYLTQICYVIQCRYDVD